jgi:hypothetical protein
MTKDLVNSLKKHLYMEVEPYQVSLNRPELYYEVKHQSSNISADIVKLVQVCVFIIIVV